MKSEGELRTSHVQTTSMVVAVLMDIFWAHQFHAGGSIDAHYLNSLGLIILSQRRAVLQGLIQNM